jgi:hypothetical protein
MAKSKYPWREGDIWTVHGDRFLIGPTDEANKLVKCRYIPLAPPDEDEEYQEEGWTDNLDIASFSDGIQAEYHKLIGRPSNKPVLKIFYCVVCQSRQAKVTADIIMDCPNCSSLASMQSNTKNET